MFEIILGDHMELYFLITAVSFFPILWVIYKEFDGGFDDVGAFAIIFSFILSLAWFFTVPILIIYYIVVGIKRIILDGGYINRTHEHEDIDYYVPKRTRRRVRTSKEKDIHPRWQAELYYREQKNIKYSDDKDVLDL